MKIDFGMFGDDARPTLTLAPESDAENHQLWALMKGIQDQAQLTDATLVRQWDKVICVNFRLAEHKA